MRHEEYEKKDKKAHWKWQIDKRNKITVYFCLKIRFALNMIRCHRQHLIIFCCVFLLLLLLAIHLSFRFLFARRELGVTFENRKLCKVYICVFESASQWQSLCMNVHMMVSYRFTTLVTPLNIYHPHQHYHLMYILRFTRSRSLQWHFFFDASSSSFFFVVSNFVHFFYSSLLSKMSFAFIFRISIARRGHANKHVNSGMRKIQRFLVS